MTQGWQKISLRAGNQNILELPAEVKFEFAAGQLVGGNGMYIPMALAAATLTNLANVAEASGVLIGTGPSAAMSDLTNFTEVKFLVWVSTQGAAASLIRAQYSLDGTTYVALSDSLSLLGTGLKASGWATIPTAARVPVLLAARAWLGDGVADPVVRALGIMVR